MNIRCNHVAAIKGELWSSGVNYLAADGLSTLQWSKVDNPEILNYLLENGADPNTESIEGALAIINAVQSNKMKQIKLLLSFHANVDKQGLRGFTAFHRAAEMGFVESVKELLAAAGANKDINAEGHTPISLAKAMNKDEIL